jgi:hypothetical protein
MLYFFKCYIFFIIISWPYFCTLKVSTLALIPVLAETYISLWAINTGLYSELLLTEKRQFHVNVVGNLIRRQRPLQNSIPEPVTKIPLASRLAPSGVKATGEGS